MKTLYKKYKQLKETTQLRLFAIFVCVIMLSGGAIMYQCDKDNLNHDDYIMLRHGF